MKNLKTILIIALIFFTGTAFAAPAANIFRTILPVVDSTYNLGSSSVRWLNGYVDNLDTATLVINGSSSGVITIQGASAAGTYTLTLPTDDGGVNEFLQTNGSGILTWSTPAGAGDVIGPGSSTNNAIVRFDGTTGKIIQDYTSGAPTVSDTGDMVIGQTLTLTNVGLHILDTNASHDLIIKAGSNITADRILTLVTGDAARTITLSGNPTLADWFDQSVKSGTSPTFTGTNITGIPASNVIIALGSGSPTIDQVQEYLNNTGSSGFFTGGVLSDGGAGTLDVAAGEGFIRTTNDSNAELLSFKWSASSGIAVADNTTQYVYVDDAGAISLSTNEFLEAPDLIQIGVVTDEGGAIESVFNLGVRLQESIGQAGRFIRRVHGITRDKRRGGLIFSQSGDANRDVTITAGELWWGRTEYVISAFDTAGADTFTTYSASGQENATASQWDNDNYDNGGTLTTMTTNRWANLFFFIEPDDHVVMIYGRSQFTSQALAEGEGVPSSSLPSRVSETSLLVARFTFQKSSNTAIISSAFDQLFANAGVTDHGDLAGLADDDHTQYLLVDASRALSANWNAGAFDITANTFIGALTGNASTATALASDPTDCGANTFAISIIASGNLTCASIGDADVPNNITIDLATLATTLTITDNESTAENNAVLFTSGGALTGGNLGIESDGTFFYTPSTGKITATGFVGALTGQADTVTTNADLTGIVTSTGNATAIADKAIAIVKIADGTDGELITWSATGVITTVAVGTAGHVLTSGGVGVAPTFQAATGAGATTELDNLGVVAINTTLVSDTDITDDLGTGDVRWRDAWFGTLSAGLTATDTLKLRGRDVDGSVYIDILTITSANTVTADLNAIVTLGGNTIATAGGAFHDGFSDFVAGEHFLQSAITTVGTIGTGVWQGTAINQTYLVGQSGTNTGDEPDASLTVKGIIEIATITETNTGTDATRAVSPDGLDGWTGSAQVVTLGTLTGLTMGGDIVMAGNNLTSTTGLNIAIGGSAGNDFTVDTNKLVVEGDTGNVGIGTDSPGAKLDVENSDATVYSGTTQHPATFIIHNPTNTDGSGAIMELKTRNANDFTATVNLGVLSEATNKESTFVIQMRDSGGYFERFRIDSSGNVGIGTTSPISPLEVEAGLTTVGAIFTLGTKETTVVANDVLGRINFYAPLEASGTDAILVGASIVAQAEAEFTASVNSTSLLFQTGASGVATTKMTLSSTGLLTLTGNLELGHASDTTLARVSAGVVSIESNNIITANILASLTVSGIIEVATGAETNTGTDATRAVSPDGLDDWTGSTQITTLGTITGGTWNGTDIAVADGGTGKSSWTQYLIPYADTTTSFSQIAIGASGQVLTSNGAGSVASFQDAGGGGGASALTLIPLPARFFNIDILDLEHSVNTTMIVGQVIIPFSITANKISIKTGSVVSQSGTAQLTLYAEDGQSQIFSVAITVTNPDDIVSASLSAVEIPAGIYYIAMNPNGNTNFKTFLYKSTLTPFGDAEGLPYDVADEPIMEGVMTITASTPPADFNPVTDITNNTNRTIIFRLDN